MFGLALLPVAAAVGIAVDYSRLTADRAELQRAADAAAIAAARADRSGTGDPEAVARDTARSNVLGARSLTIHAVDHEAAGGVHVVEIAATRVSLFGNLGGAAERRIGVRAEAAFERVGRPAEIAIVFDTTNSMSFGTRWNDAVRVIGDMLSRLKARNDDSFFVSLVPFGDRVNIEDVPDARRWVTGLPPGRSWNGCVEPRVVEGREDFPWSLDDALPVDGSTLFLATHRDNMPEDHLGQRYGRNRMPDCPSASVVPPTTNVAVIERALERLRPAGTGRFDEGLAWGWRLVSPAWSGAWSVPGYPAAEGARDKIVMVFTDGQSTAYDYEVGGPDGGSYGHNKGSRTGFAHFVDLCARMKASGVRIMMVQLEGNHHFTPYARACASSAEDYHFVAGFTDLVETLAGIGVSGGDIRIVR